MVHLHQWPLWEVPHADADTIPGLPGGEGHWHHCVSSATARSTIIVRPPQFPHRWTSRGWVMGAGSSRNLVALDGATEPPTPNTGGEEPPDLDIIRCSREGMRKGSGLHWTWCEKQCSDEIQRRERMFNVATAGPLERYMACPFAIGPSTRFPSVSPTLNPAGVPARHCPWSRTCQ